MRLTHRAGSCDNGPCPNVFDTDDPAGWAVVQGRRVTDQAALRQLAKMPADEALVLTPPEVLIEYVIKKGTAGTADEGFEDFDAHFDRFRSTAFRLETLQRYEIDEEDSRLVAYRNGLPRPERSVRTTPWLRRVAVTTAFGKSWQRVHVVQHPLSEYMRYQLIGYRESAAAGDEILIADRAASTELATLGPDFWLFDAGTPDPFALLMHYDERGNFLGFEHTTRPGDIARCVQQQQTALKYAMSLNSYLAAPERTRKVA